MAGTKRLLDNGKWELCASVGSDISGKRIRKYKYVVATGPREADNLLAEFVSECYRADYSEGENMTLKNYSELWKKDYVEKHLRVKTNFRYESLLERIIETLGHKKLKELKPPHLLQFYNMLAEDGVRKDKVKVKDKLIQKPGGLSPKTIRHHHALLSSMLQDAVEWGMIKENICSRVKPPKVPKKEKEFFSIDQAKQLLAALDVEDLKYRVMVILAIFTGFRRGEIMGLEWSDINSKDKTIDVSRSSLYTPKEGIFEDETKTDKSQRTVYVPETIIKLLQNYHMWWNGEKTKAKDKWNETNRLFVQWDGKPMHPDTISQWFPEFIRRHKLPHLTYHGLRHTHASILLAMGMDLNSVADQLGHAGIQMLVENYAHNARKKSKEAATHLENALMPRKPRSKKSGGVNGGVEAKK